MFQLRRPTADFIDQTIQAQRDTEFTYPHIGLSRESVCPEGYTINQSRAVIGTGEPCFRRAKEAIRNCQMLNVGWLQAVHFAGPIINDSLVPTLVWTMGLYALNVARVVYVDDVEGANQFGFGYGTLSEYPVSGEERFTVKFDPTTGDVSYELFSFSKPASLLTRIGWPVVRMSQRRFGRDSIAAMIVAANEASA